MTSSLRKGRDIAPCPLSSFSPTPTTLFLASPNRRVIIPVSYAPPYPLPHVFERRTPPSTLLVTRRHRTMLHRLTQTTCLPQLPHQNPLCSTTPHALLNRHPLPRKQPRPLNVNVMLMIEVRIG